MVNSHALRLVPSLNESRWFHAWNRVSCTRSSARSLSPHSDTPNARKLPISATRASRRLEDTLGRKLFFSALLKILKQSQEVLRYWLSRDFVENRANVAADVCLKGEGKAVIRPNTLTLAWRAGDVLIHCLV